MMFTVAPPQGLCSGSPRGKFPSPTFCERQRAARRASSQGTYNGQPSYTASASSFHYQRRSPQVAGQTVPSPFRRATTSSYRSTSRGSPKNSPAPAHSTNQRSTPHQMDSQQVHSQPANQMKPASGSACPLPRTARPRTMSLDPELIAEIDRAHSMGLGMSGVAYAGGAISGAVPRSTHLKSGTLPEESTIGLASSGKRPIPPGSGEGPTRVQRRNTSSRDKDCETSELHRRGSVECDPPQRISAHQPSSKIEVQRPDSPKYSYSLSDPDDHASYKSGDRELLLAQGAALSPSPSVPSQNQCADPLRSAPRSAARVNGKSLPIHEESEEHWGLARNDKREQEGDRWNFGECEDRRPVHKHGQDGRDRGRQQYVASPLKASSDPVAEYPHSPKPSHSRPGAPIPSTTHSYSTTTSPPPSPLVSGMSRENGMKLVLPPHSPVPRVDSPYPDPFRHIPRKSYAGPANETVGLSPMNPNVVHEQCHRQVLASELNNGGMVSDSTLSPSSTPLQYDPLTFLQTSSTLSGRRGGILGDSQASTRSSPSHEPVTLPPFGRGERGRRHPKRSQDLGRQSKTRPPPRVESTQPRGTNPELSSVEETAEFKPRQSVPQPMRRDESADDEDETNADDEKWIDEDVGLEGVADDDLLQLEFHPDYDGDPEKRRRKWMHRWETVLRNLRSLDRETNTPLVLVAAPSHTGKLHYFASRAVRCDSSLKPTDMKNIRSAFAEISSRRHSTSTASLLEQLSRARACLSSWDGSPSSSSGAREKDLRWALDTAIGSLHAIGTLYEQRETRWAKEKLKLEEDREKVQSMLKQVLGAGVFCTVGDPTAPA